MDKLSDDQVTELLAWARLMLDINKQQTPVQQDVLQRLIVLIGGLPREQREPIVDATRDVLRTIIAIYEGLKQAPQFIRGDHDDAQ